MRDLLDDPASVNQTVRDIMRDRSSLDLCIVDAADQKHAGRAGGLKAGARLGARKRGAGSLNLPQRDRNTERFSDPPNGRRQDTRAAPMISRTSEMPFSRSHDSSPSITSGMAVGLKKLAVPT